MAGRKKQGGYMNNYGMTDSQTVNVKLPPKIRCDRCKKHKQESNFSNKQLIELKSAIVTLGAQAGITAAKARCRSCTGQQKTEMYCNFCDATKSLDGFFKTQRRDPDKAKCKVCIQEQLDMDPGTKLDELDESDPESALEDAGYDSDITKYPDEDMSTLADDTSSHGGVDLGGFDDLSITGSVTVSAAPSDSWASKATSSRTVSLNSSGPSGGARLPTASNSDVWEVVGNKRATGSKATSASENTSPWSKGSGLGGRRYGGPSSSSTARVPAGRATPAASSSKFAKVRAYKPEKEKDDYEPEPEPEKKLLSGNKHEEPSFGTTKKWEDSDDSSDGD
ncbi:hypothetical protein K402DRAFT_452288 [Aulographum hederae CBS 113979]|uniref:Stc1 domain-containing protein n=1 Tax=Aulographum hederae CBS 113979 TaxID=1176131 RepID=A0A6G1H777_9PEZI|nr:hypothetical protein K402DRAFT_452288 [Aulographum hederae CBS 113979]